MTVAGEPTAETGRQIAAGVLAVTGTPEVVVGAHGDDYAGYMATAVAAAATDIASPSRACRAAAVRSSRPPQIPCRR